MKRDERVPDLPFTLYAVHNTFGDATLESVKVVRITPTKWWFGGRSGLAFDCRTGCEPHNFYLTPRAAWEAFREVAMDDYKEAEQRIAIADKELAK